MKHYIKAVAVQGKAEGLIDDDLTQNGKTWSSEKIDSEIVTLGNSKINKSDFIFNTTQKDVNTGSVWIDGKSIYRTCYHFNKNALVIYDNKWVTIMQTGSNIDYLISLKIAIKTDTSSTYGITDFNCFSSSNPITRQLVVGKDIRLAYSSSSSDHSYTFPYECVLIAEYTIR